MDIKHLFKQGKDFRTIGKNYGSLLILQIANYVLPILTIPYLVRVLGTERFGLVMFAQALTIFLGVFVEFGFDLSATRRISLAKGRPGEISRSFWSVYINKAFLAIAAFLVLLLLISSFDRFANEPYVYLLSFGMIVGQVLFPDWYFLGIERMTIITICNLIIKTTFTILIFSFVHSPEDYLLVPLFTAIGYLISGITGFLYSLPRIARKMPELSLVKQIFMESLPLFFSNLAIKLSTSASVFILGLVGGNVIAGLFASIDKIIVILKGAFSPLYQALYPWLSTKEKPNQRKFVLSLWPYILFASLIPTLVILFLGTWVLEVIYDDPLINNYVWVFKLCSINITFAALSLLVVNLYFPASKAYKLRLKVLIPGCVVQIVLLILLSLQFGITGTATATVLSEITILILAIYYFRHSTLKTALQKIEG